MTAVAILTCLLPIFAIVLTSVMNVAGDFRWSNFTLDKYRYVLFTRPDTARGFVNSFVLAFGAATAAAAAGTGLAYVKAHPRLGTSRLVDVCVNLPYAAPGTILALGLILVWSRPLALTDTLWILLIAYFAKHLSFAVRSVTTAVQQTDVTLEEAARVSGASLTTAFRTIWLPLLRPAILAGWFLVFMPAFGELTMSILLVGPGTETVGTVLFALQEYADPPSASVVAVLILAFILAAYGAVAGLRPDEPHRPQRRSRSGSGTSRRFAASTSRSRKASCSRCSAPPAAARRPRCAASRASRRPTPDASTWPAATLFDGRGVFVPHRAARHRHGVPVATRSGRT